jgi:hypothetical protein
MNDWQTAVMLEIYRFHLQSEARPVRFAEEESGPVIAPSAFDQVLAGMGRWMEKTGKRLQERAIAPVSLNPVLGRQKG